MSRRFDEVFKENIADVLFLELFSLGHRLARQCPENPVSGALMNGALICVSQSIDKLVGGRLLLSGHEKARTDSTLFSVRFSG